MRIRFLLGHAYGRGGAIRTTLNIAGALAERGHDVEVISVIRRWTRPVFPISKKVRLRVLTDLREAPRLSLSPRQIGGRAARALLSRFPSRLFPCDDKFYPFVTLWTDLKLWRYFRIQHGGVAIGTNPGLNQVVARLAGADVVTVGEEHLNLARRSPAKQETMSKHHSRLDALFTLTDVDAEAYRTYLNCDVEVRAIPNAVPELPSRPPATLDSKVVVAAGRLRPQKGFDLLIRAWPEVAAAHPDWELQIYGRGPERRKLKALIDDLGLGQQVILAGFHRNFPSKLHASSLFVLSSRYEGFPMVLLEAAGYGVPAVAFDCPTGPSEIIEHGVSGLLVPAMSVSELAAAINQMIEDPELRRRMGAAALMASERYSREEVVLSWECLLNELVARKDSQYELAS